METVRPVWILLNGQKIIQIASLTKPMIRAKKAGRKNGNLEDQLRIANELLRGLKILDDEKANNLREKIVRTLKRLRKLYTAK